MFRHWKREYEAQSGEFAKKKRELSLGEHSKALKKEFKEVTLERDILKKR